MKRLALTLLSLALMVMATGCCCLGHHCGHQRCDPCSTYYGGGCPGGNCDVGGGGYIGPQGALPNSYGNVQTGYTTSPGPVAVSPVNYQAGYHPAAQYETLPTYR